MKPPAAAVILSANPIHDTGGGQRSAQIALELLERDHAVLFVSHGRVTETVDLGLSFDHPRLVQTSLADVGGRRGRAVLDPFLAHPRSLVLTQIAVPSWLPVLRSARRMGAVSVYDLIDEWESELGRGWYRRGTERRVAALSHLLVATAPSLQRRLRERTRRPAALLPNGFNSRVFRPSAAYARPHDLPGGPVALYVGALWGGWMDWALVDRAARALPEVSFVFVGDHRGEGAGLPGNCAFLGLRAQGDLPAYLAHARVGILPWKDDALTQATSPLKVYEYVAMGLQVAAPRLEPLEGIPGVRRCADPPAFVAAVAEAVAGGPGAATRAAMASFAEGQAWPRRVDALLALAEGARARPTPGGGLLGRLGRWLALLIGAVAVLAPTPTPLSGQSGEPSTCPGPRVGRIVVDNGDVFAPSRDDWRPVRWAMALGNALHVRTTAGFIRGELLFTEGDCFDPWLLAESQRLLDAYRFLRDVRVTPGDQEGDSITVHVRTQDEWSTDVSGTVTYDDGINVERVVFTERNFLGRGVDASLSRYHRQEVQGRSFSVSSPRLFGRTNASVGLGDSPEGWHFNQGVSYPFVGEANRTSLSQSYRRTPRAFAYATGSAGTPRAVIARLHEAFEVAAARRLGPPGASVILGASLRREVTRTVGEPVLPPGGDGAAGAGGAGAGLSALERQLEDRASTQVAFHLGTRRYRYQEYQGLDAVREPSTVGIGHFAGITVGRSLPVVRYRAVPDAADAFGRVHGSFGAAVGASLLHGGLTAEASRSRGRWRDVLVSADVVGYGRSAALPGHTLFARASAAAGGRTSVPFQLSLGGRDGVRSLPEDALPGGRRLFFVVEDRVRLDWPDWSALDLGLTLFADAGRVWAGDAPWGADSGWHASAGAGIRFGFPRGTRNITRVDLAAPVTGGGSPIFRVTYEVNRLRNGFTSQDVDRSRRFNRGPEHF